MGTGAFRQKNYDQAIKYFSQAVQVNSNYVGAYYYRGLSYLAITQYDNAIADAVADLGQPEQIGQIFAGFQKYLYAQKMVVN